jgi:hypothetical protein
MKRLAAGLLWALVVMWIGSYVALFVGLPTIGTLPFGLLAVALAVNHGSAPRSPTTVQPAAPSPISPGRTGLARS